MLRAIRLVGAAAVALGTAVIPQSSSAAPGAPATATGAQVYAGREVRGFPFGQKGFAWTVSVTIDVGVDGEMNEYVLRESDSAIPLRKLEWQCRHTAKKNTSGFAKTYPSGPRMISTQAVGLDCSYRGATASVSLSCSDYPTGDMRIEALRLAAPGGSGRVSIMCNYTP